MNEKRPDPDQVLAKVNLAERSARRGTLRIYFGYAAGVGKTYAMLVAARREAAQGHEILIGYLEPHARPETQRLAVELPQLAAREVVYRNVVLREFDLDAALERKPAILLVDELAHTNAHGSRHAKRWQDVEELLEAGITVWTTLNVQHIESLNDVVGQVTGVRVQETIPDRIFETADEIELVDMTPEALLERLAAGKVYVAEQASRASQAFFQKANLDALRELSLRTTARRVHHQVETARRDRAIREPWATAECLLVCVSPSRTTPRVIRTAKRMAAALDAPWIALAVDVTGAPSGDQTSQRLNQHLQLAERLGAETVLLAGQSVADTVLDYARSRNVTQIVIGKTHQPRWRRLLWGTVVDEILEQSGKIDVYVIRGEGDDEGEELPAVARAHTPWWRYLQALTIVLGCTVFAQGLRQLHLADAEANTVMVFLAGVAWSAFRYGQGPAIAASVLAVLLFDFLFVPPFHTLVVADAQYLVTFAVMLSISWVISTLTARLRAQIEATRERERRTRILYELGRQLSSLYGRSFLASAFARKLADLWGSEIAVYWRGQDCSLQILFGEQTTLAQDPRSRSVATWVSEHGRPAGIGTSTLPEAPGFFFPLTGSQRIHGAIAVQCVGDRIPGDRAAATVKGFEPQQRELLESCANQLALALERDEMAIAAAEARVEAEGERIRSSLLSSVSHDLKTPLASIAGSSSSLLCGESLPAETRRALLKNIAGEALRLNRLLDNLLQMSKLEAGAIAPNRQWHVLEELLGSALHRTEEALAKHKVQVEVPHDMPLIFVDGLLIEQLLVNLLENAARHTPAGTSVRVRAWRGDEGLVLSVGDRGPGVPPRDIERIFDKFYRAASAPDGGRGSGLGLAICRAIARIHGGAIRAANAPEGGVTFTLTLPLPLGAPQITLEDDSCQAPDPTS